MGGNIVKLIFSCISTGSGWDKLRNSVKDSLKNMGQLSGALRSVSMLAGTVGGAIGRTLSAFAMGSIWGVAAEGAKMLIEKLGIFKDRTEETKEKLDKLEESTRRFYETINANSQKSLEKIDKETKRRNEQLDITNRMIKAELQLQKARALASGDTQGVERIDRQMVEADQRTAMQKAQGDMDAAARRRDVQASKMAKAIQEARTAEQELKKADAALAAKSKPILIEPKVGAPGSLPMMVNQDTTNERAAVQAAQDRLVKARELGASAKEAYAEEVRRYNLSKDVVKALKAEQGAANAEAERAASKSNYERQLAYNKQIRDLEAKINAEIRSRDSLNEDELEQLRAKYEQRREEAELAVKDAEGKKLMADRYGTDQDKAVADKELKLARERVKTIAAEEKKAEEDLAQKKKEERIKALQEEIRKENEARKRALQEDIEANSKRATDLQQKLADANKAAEAAHDVFGNAGNMDQGGDLADKRREWMNNLRFAEGAADLIGSGKIRRGPNGEWLANGRLSNLNQAILDRLNADERKKKLENENDKVVKKLDELKKAIEQMSTL